MTKIFPILAAAIILPACGTVKGAASDVGAVGKTAVQMVRDIPLPDLPGLPALPVLDPSPFTEATEEVRAYCAAVSERWEIGRDQVKVGGGLVSEGRERMKNGQKIVREGERRIATGQLALDEARREAALRSGRMKPEARDYAKLNDPDLMATIHAKMNNGLARMEYGGEQVAYGASEIEIAQGRMVEGIARLKQGHALMAEDDGRCREFTKRVVTVGDPVMETEAGQ